MSIAAYLLPANSLLVIDEAMRALGAARYAKMPLFGKLSNLMGRASSQIGAVIGGLLGGAPPPGPDQYAWMRDVHGLGGL